MFISFCITNDEGQFDGSSFALEVKNVCFQGTSQDRLYVIITHMDNQRERITIGCPDYEFEINGIYIHDFSIVDYPAVRILSKDEFYNILGKGQFIEGNNNYFS